MVPLLWGRAEGVRSTFLRTFAQALAPVTFGGVSDYVFGGGRAGLQLTFLLMLIPLAGSAYFLFRALATYPRDVATARCCGSTMSGLNFTAALVERLTHGQERHAQRWQLHLPRRGERPRRSDRY